MGLTIDYFYNLTPRQFANIQRGWSDRRDAESKERIMLVRKIMWSNLAPWSKGITEEKLWPLEFLNIAQPTEAPTEEALQQSIERWRKRDELLAKQKATD
jgi:hypothetical protein